MENQNQIRVLVGIRGALSSKLLHHLLENRPVVCMSRDSVSCATKEGIHECNSLIDGIKWVNPEPSLIIVIFSFRSREMQSLDYTFGRILDIVNDCKYFSESQLRIVFINSICAIANEKTQGLFYHVEKGLMRRMHHWFTDEKIVMSSLNITLHVVPKEKKNLEQYVIGLIELIDLHGRININGSEIMYGRDSCYSVG